MIIINKFFFQIKIINEEKDKQISSLNADLVNREGQIEALKADIVRRAGENGSLSEELSEKNTELDSLKARFEELLDAQSSFESRINLMKQWFVKTIAASASEEESASSSDSVFMRFKIRPTDSPKVRNEPGTSGKVIGHAPASSEYEVLGVSPGVWLQIRLDNGKVGWISSKMGTLTELLFPFETENEP